MKIIRTGGNGRRSQASEYAGIVYTSGITTTFLQGTITEQAQDVLEQIDAVLARHGTDKTNVLRANIYLTNMADYGAFNAVWDEWVIDGMEPAREVTQGELALAEYKLKISVIAAKK